MTRRPATANPHSAVVGGPDPAAARAPGEPVSGPLPVSVVIPVYNGAAFLAAALESVRAQTRPPAEVIVVDDGSTDASAEIAIASGAHVLRHPHQGPSPTRNAGILTASQPWVAFLDADDLWEPEKLSCQWVAVERCPHVGIVFTDCTLFCSGRTVVDSFLAQRRNYRHIARTVVAPGVMFCDPDSLRRYFIKGNFIQPSTALIRRDLLLHVGLFDVGLVQMEDRELWLRLLALCSAAVVERPLMRSRLHDSNASSDAPGMTLAATMVAERVFAHPERYPLGAVAYYRAELPSLYLDCGRYAEEAHDITRARGAYLRSWRSGGGLRPLGLYVLSHLPSPLRRLAKTIFHLLSCPAPRTAG